MDTLLLTFGFLLILLGLAGSFLPIIPGPITSWTGLLLLFLTTVVSMNTTFLWITGIIALGIFILDNIIPILGARKYGGGKGSVIGSTVGLIFGMLFLGPLGILIGPFLGAFLGELIVNTKNTKGAFRAAFGSLIGFVTGVFLKFMISMVFLIYFLKIVWQYRAELF